tara:strand:+ start:1055 stop:1219 length:165 start_codon:yes stop_codon:yes gene_type:complete
MKKVKHYLKSGKEFKGKSHKMANGQLHTGATHTASSQRLFHKADLPKKIQAKLK